MTAGGSLVRWKFQASHVIRRTEIKETYSMEGMMLKLKLQYFGGRKTDPTKAGGRGTGTEGPSSHMQASGLLKRRAEAALSRRVRPLLLGVN